MEAKKQSKEAFLKWAKDIAEASTLDVTTAKHRRHHTVFDPEAEKRCQEIYTAVDNLVDYLRTKLETTDDPT